MGALLFIPHGGLWSAYVLLDIDLPAVQLFQPDRRVGTSAHTKTSFGYGLTDPAQKRYNRIVTAAR